jgi:hypothetical protein
MRSITTTALKTTLHVTLQPCRPGNRPDSPPTVILGFLHKWLAESPVRDNMMRVGMLLIMMRALDTPHNCDIILQKGKHAFIYGGEISS